MAEFPTAEELETLFREGKMERIGMGSRRACYRIPETDLCVKCYRSDEEIEEGMYNGAQELSPSVVREIKCSRFDEKRNTCCQEYRYWRKLRKRLPSKLFSVFPQTMECFFISSRGWCIVQELVLNFDGTVPERFSRVYRASSMYEKKQLLADLKVFVSMLIAYSVRLYDPQNITIQWISSLEFRLRVVDFEPVSRCLISIDMFCPPLVRAKTIRRVRRWMREHIGCEYE